MAIEPCPYCGSNDLRVEEHDELEFMDIPPFAYHHRVICDECSRSGFQASVGGKYIGTGKPGTKEQKRESISSAIFAWNRRRS